MVKPVILLVDDNKDIIELLKFDLGKKYTILKSHNGKEAVDVLCSETVHLVVTDIMMPVMDGYELCKIIKSDFHTSHIPVILLTAKNTFRSKMEGLELGADAYIDKPFSLEHLQVQIANLLVNRNKIKEHFANSPLVNIKSIAYSKADEQFLEELNGAIHLHMNDQNLDVEQIAKYMNMSRPTLYRKIKAISDLTPNELINIARLKKAAVLLAEGTYSINEVGEMVGYTSPTHFGRNFQKQFSLTPSEYLKGKK
jgi:two-component system cell cycle response regulator